MILISYFSARDFICSFINLTMLRISRVSVVAVSSRGKWALEPVKVRVTSDIALLI